MQLKSYNAIGYSRGAGLSDNHPQARNAESFPKFVAALDADRAPRKETAPYICGPLNGDGHRSRETAAPRAWLAVDLDRIDPDRLPDVRLWFARFSGIAWATHSSTPASPRERVILELDRLIDRTEGVTIGAVIKADVNEKFGDAVLVDESTFRAEQPVFVAPPGVQFARFEGERLDVDAYLAKSPKVTKPEAHDDDDVIDVDRNKRLTSIAGKLRRTGLSASELEAALLAVNRERCAPPLDDAEIRKIARSVGRYEANEPDAPQAALLKTESGLILPCEHNAFVLIAAASEYATLHFDEFLSRLRIGERDWTDDDDLEVVRWLQSKHYVARFNLGQARNGARAVAHMRKRDSLREFVESLPAWDGTPRIEHAFTEAWGAPDSAVIQAASRNFFVALCARALHPGAQVDTLWTFEGPQGILKSAALRALGGAFHAEISAGVGTIDFQRELRGIWLAEMSELDSLRGREASTIKRLLSAPTDRFVQKYELHAKSYPRRAVAVATTNEANYWQDSTGARRLIPIPCGEIRVDLIAVNRRQWFAEARQLHAAGATWWEFPGIEAEQEERQHIDPWEDMLRGYIAHGKRGAGFGGDLAWPDGPITSAVIMHDWLRLEASQQGRASGVRLGHVMRRLGFVPARIGHEQDRGWCRADT